MPLPQSRPPRCINYGDAKMSASSAMFGVWDQYAVGGGLGAPLRHIPTTNVVEAEPDASNRVWHTSRVANVPVIFTVHLRAPKNVPIWLGRVVDRLGHITRLPANWDSYGARPIAVAAIKSALELLGEIMSDDLPSPDIVPTVSGGIQIEWHIVGIDLELEVSAEGKRAIFFEDSHGQNPLTEDEAKIPDMVRVLRKRIIESSQSNAM